MPKINKQVPPATNVPQAAKIPSTLTIREDDLPDIKDWKVGETYHIMLEAQEISADSHADQEGDVPSEARFKIISAKAMGGNAQTNTGNPATPNMQGKVMNAMSKKAKSYA